MFINYFNDYLKKSVKFKLVVIITEFTFERSNNY